jgi:hydroxymethylpyrimidine pyrophosphatase-like HAD family hydrolase
MAQVTLLAVDLDGTLISDVGNFDSPVSRNNLDALRELRRAGTRILISTGRNESSTRSILARCGDPELAACDLLLQNGSLILDGRGGSVLRERRLDRGEAMAYLDRYREFGLTALLFESHERGGACLFDGEPANDRLARYLEIRRREELSTGRDCPRRVERLEDHLDIDPSALATIDHPERIAPAREAMVALNLPGSRVAVQGLIGRGGSGPAQFLEVFHREVSKELAFVDYCRAKGIPLEDTAAIGDGRNDLELLSRVGLGIAMGNAGPALKEVADHVAPCHDEDGVAAAIREHLLN